MIDKERREDRKSPNGNDKVKRRFLLLSADQSSESAGKNSAFEGDDAAAAVRKGTGGEEVAVKLKKIREIQDKKKIHNDKVVRKLRRLSPSIFESANE